MKCTKDLLLKMKDDMLAKHVKATAQQGKQQEAAPTTTAAATQPVAASPAAPTEEAQVEKGEEAPGMERLDVASSVDSDVEVEHDDAPAAEQEAAPKE